MSTSNSSAKQERKDKPSDKEQTRKRLLDMILRNEAQRKAKPK